MFSRSKSLKYWVWKYAHAKAVWVQPCTPLKIAIFSNLDFWTTCHYHAHDKCRVVSHRITVSKNRWKCESPRCIGSKESWPTLLGRCIKIHTPSWKIYHKPFTKGVLVLGNFCRPTGKREARKKGKMDRKRRKIVKGKVKILNVWNGRGKEVSKSTVAFFSFFLLLLFTFWNNWDLFWVYQNGNF